MRLCYRHSPAQGQIHRPRQPLGHPLTVGRCKMLALGDGVLVGRLLPDRSEEHTSELQSLAYLVCRLLLEKKKNMAHITNKFYGQQIKINNILLPELQLQCTINSTTRVTTNIKYIRKSVSQEPTPDAQIHT